MRQNSVNQYWGVLGVLVGVLDVLVGVLVVLVGILGVFSIGMLYWFLSFSIWEFGMVYLVFAFQKCVELCLYSLDKLC